MARAALYAALHQHSHPGCYSLGPLIAIRLFRKRPLLPTRILRLRGLLKRRCSQLAVLRNHTWELLLTTTALYDGARRRRGGMDKPAPI
jgi:hypothetical protein